MLTTGFNTIRRVLREASPHEIECNGTLIECTKCKFLIDCIGMSAQMLFDSFVTVDCVVGKHLGRINFFVYKRPTIRELLEKRS